MTLCIIYQHPRILLGMKKLGLGQGRWNGFGGKVTEGEIIEAAAKREVEEEAGIKIKNLEKIGIIDFKSKGKTEISEVHIFKSDKFTGEPTESEEMRPKWFHIDEIPFKEMWPSDTYWWPLFLKGRKFKGKFLFGEADVILEKELIEVEKI